MSAYSATASPTVVAMILTTQKYSVTGATLSKVGSIVFGNVALKSLSIETARCAHAVHPFANLDAAAGK
jgi:hypothetical protein